MNIRKYLFLTWMTLAFITISTFVSEVTSEELDKTPEPNKKHDYKLTFKKPYYFNGTVPFWDIYGSKSSFRLYYEKKMLMYMYVIKLKTPLTTL